MLYLMKAKVILYITGNDITEFYVNYSEDWELF